VKRSSVGILRNRKCVLILQLVAAKEPKKQLYFGFRVHENYSTFFWNKLNVLQSCSRAKLWSYSDSSVFFSKISFGFSVLAHRHGLKN
jgi:hypothetical protein